MAARREMNPEVRPEIRTNVAFTRRGLRNGMSRLWQMRARQAIWQPDLPGQDAPEDWVNICGTHGERVPERALPGG
jgi:hypothetical protein